MAHSIGKLPSITDGLFYFGLVRVHCSINICRPKPPFTSQWEAEGRNRHDLCNPCKDMLPMDRRPPMKVLHPQRSGSQAFLHECGRCRLIQIAINLILNSQIQTLAVVVYGTNLLLTHQFPLLEALPTELN